MSVCVSVCIACAGDASWRKEELAVRYPRAHISSTPSSPPPLRISLVLPGLGSLGLDKSLLITLNRPPPACPGSASFAVDLLKSFAKGLKGSRDFVVAEQGEQTAELSLGSGDTSLQVSRGSSKRVDCERKQTTRVQVVAYRWAWWRVQIY